MHGGTRKPAGRSSESAWQAGCPSTILLVTALYLALGTMAFVAWAATNNVRWVEVFFRIPAALLLIWLSGMEYWLSSRVCSQLWPDEPLRRAWVLIAMSAACHLLSAILVQGVSNREVSLLAGVSGSTSAVASRIRDIGLVIGGPFRYALLAAGLYMALRVYRRAGFLSRLKAIDWVLLAGIGSYIVLEFNGVVVAVRAGKLPGLFEIANWPVDPLMCLLVGEGLLLHRSVQAMGAGRISRCWRAFSLGPFLIFLGDFGLYLTNYGYLPWPWSSAAWYAWLPASCAFALAPAYQLEAMWHATTAGVRRGPGPATVA